VGGTWVSLENVNFEFKRADITPKCAEKIAKLATWMNENRHVAIGLDGHVDDAKANDNDPTLSARRVQAVRGALIAGALRPTGFRSAPSAREGRCAVTLPMRASAQSAGRGPRRQAMMLS